MDGGGNDISAIRVIQGCGKWEVILDKSNMIEATTLMRVEMKGKVKQEKEYLLGRGELQEELILKELGSMVDR